MINNYNHQLFRFNSIITHRIDPDLCLPFTDMSISLAPIHIPAIRPGFESDATTPVKRHTLPWQYENEFNQYHHASPYYLDRDRKPMFYGYPETQFQVSFVTRQKLRLELRSRRDWAGQQQVNNVNITLNPLSLFFSYSPPPPLPRICSLHTGPTIVISRPQLQRRPTLTPPTTAMLQLMWRQRRDSLWRAPRSPATIRPPTPRQVGCAPSPRPTRAQVSYRLACQIAALSQRAARSSCATCQICCSISVLAKQTQKLICDI